MGSVTRGRDLTLMPLRWGLTDATRKGFRELLGGESIHMGSTAHPNSTGTEASMLRTPQASPHTPAHLATRLCP